MPPPPSMLWNGPETGRLTVILAHGAGAPMDSPFMERMAMRLAERSWRVGRFEFPYMAARRSGGRGGAPDRAPVLEACWRAVIAACGPASRLVIGGKSMGGRIASAVADEAGVAGLICLGYPFHPPRRPDRTRTEHLGDLATPTLIVQGTRDELGNREEISGYTLSAAIRVVFLEDGDHSFKPRVRSGHTHDDHLDAALAAMDAFLDELNPATPGDRRSAG